MKSSYIYFWSRFLKYCTQNESIFRDLAVPKGAFMSKTSNKVRVDLCAYKSSKLCDSPVRVEVYFTGRTKEDHNKDFDFFFQYRVDIEKELGFGLVWELENPKVKSRKIYCTNPLLEVGKNDELIFDFFDSIETRLLQVFGKYRHGFLRNFQRHKNLLMQAIL